MKGDCNVSVNLIPNISPKIFAKSDRGLSVQLDCSMVQSGGISRLQSANNSVPSILFYVMT